MKTATTTSKHPRTLIEGSALGARERWLERATLALAPALAAAGAPLPENGVRVTCGWPHKGAVGKRAQRIGECWDPRAASDGRTQIFISPSVADSVQALGILVHELVHAGVGVRHGHRGAFASAARAMGLAGKLTECAPGPQLAIQLQALATHLGEYPHAALNPNRSGIKKQPTRMLKAACPSCGYSIRLTRTWAEMGLPKCPLCNVTLDCPALAG